MGKQFLMRPHVQSTYLSTGEKVASKQFANLQEYKCERNTLLYFKGEGCAKLLHYDNSKQTLYIEWVDGPNLKTYFPNQDEMAVRCIVEVIQKLHQPHSDIVFEAPELRFWFRTLFKDHPFHVDLLKDARKMTTSLLAQSKEKMLLHGDLHHENVILSNAGPIAIDPKGVWGDPLFDVACSIYNPIDLLPFQPNLAGILEARIQLFASLMAAKPCKIAQWAFVGAVLAICWCVEDGWEYSSLLNTAHELHRFNL